MLLKMGVVVCKRYRCTEVADNEEEEMVAVLTAPPPLMADGRRLTPPSSSSLWDWDRCQHGGARHH